LHVAAQVKQAHDDVNTFAYYMGHQNFTLMCMAIFASVKKASPQSSVQGFVHEMLCRGAPADRRTGHS
jgi:hypothetical protein